MDELKILTTDVEKNTHDISKLDDFFQVYISNASSRMELEPCSEDINLSPAMIGIITDAINIGVASGMGVQYVADIAALPLDVQQKFRAGKLVLQNSNKVVGNSIASLVDPNNPGKFVANLTLKEVPLEANVANIGANLLIQMQLKQISDKLDSIYDMVKFQIKNEREKSLLVPFFVARDYIVKAQVTQDETSREEYLGQALYNLKQSYESGYVDLKNYSELLAQKTNNPFKRKHNEIRQYMINICEDMYLMNKCIGLELQIYDYQEKKEESKETFEQYAYLMTELSENAVGTNAESTIVLLQDNYPYRSSNKDMWYNYSKSICELKAFYDGIGSSAKTRLICAEG